jgi:hypothetical protein
MATSGTTSFAMTARDIVTAALDESAILPLGELPTPDELGKCIIRLNAMLKSWQMQGCTWKQETISVATVAATASITLPAYVRGVNGVRFVESGTFERQMQRFERDEYFRLPNKASAGKSTAYYVERSTSGLRLYVWPVPAAVSSLKVDIDRAMDAVTDEDQTVDIPEELQETVYANLAVRCHGLFQQDRAVSQELAFRAARLEREMLDSYRPASYYLEAF